MRYFVINFSTKHNWVLGVGLAGVKGKGSDSSQICFQSLLCPMKTGVLKFRHGNEICNAHCYSMLHSVNWKGRNILEKKSHTFYLKPLKRCL